MYASSLPIVAASYLSSIGSVRVDCESFERSIPSASHFVSGHFGIVSIDVSNDAFAASSASTFGGASATIEATAGRAAGIVAERRPATIWPGEYAATQLAATRSLRSIVNWLSTAIDDALA